MSTLATLQVNLIADTSNFSTGLANAKSDIANFATQAAAGMASIGGGVLMGAGAAVLAVGTGLVAAFKGAIAETIQFQNVQAQTNAVLKSTGGVAGVTADMVTQLADKYSQLTPFQDDVVRGGENLLLTFTSIGQDIFPQATDIMLDMSQALGQDLKSSAIQLGKALQDPILGVTALRRVGANFNEEDKKMIENLVNTGRTAEAQKYIMAELAKEFGGSAEAAGQTLGGQLAILGNRFNDIKKTVGAALMPALMQFAQFLNTELNKPEVQAFITNLAQAIGNFAMTVVNNIPSVVQWFQNAFGWLEEHKGIMVGVFTALGAAVAVFVWTTVSGLLPAIAVMALIGAAAYLLYQAWTTNFGGIQEKAAAVWAWLQPVLMEIWNWLSINIPIAIQAMSAFWNNVLVPAVQSAWAFIQSVIQAGMQFISDLTSGKLGWISQVWSNTWSAIQVAVQTVMTVIMLVFNAFKAAFQGDWYSFGYYLGTAWRLAWDMIGVVFSTAWSNIKIIFGQIIESIITTFKTTDWGAVGRGIIRGIGDGLGAMKGWLLEAARNIASAVMGALKGFFGIRSPSELMRDVIGRNMALGIVAGWEGVLNVNPLKPALANAVSMPSVSVPAVSGAAGAGGNTSSELMRDFQDALNEFNMRLRTLPDDLARANNGVLVKIAQRS
ncbi:MAG: phage tail length tape measure family protein [Chloroflexi bacterium]|nr:phage tail length tape measure family protein [Chloroflexota bacterium]